MANRKITELPVLPVTPANTQQLLFATVDSSGLVPITKRVAFDILKNDIKADSVIFIDTEPTTNKGLSGDKKGMVYLGTNYLYYCTQNYNGSSNIWSRITSTNSW